MIDIAPKTSKGLAIATPIRTLILRNVSNLAILAISKAVTFLKRGTYDGRPRPSNLAIFVPYGGIGIMPMTVVKLLGWLLETVVTFVVLIVLAIVAFYITVFVVSTGAGLAGYDPSGDFVVLSASLLVVAALLGGIPFGQSREVASEPDGSEHLTGFQ